MTRHINAEDVAVAAAYLAERGAPLLTEVRRSVRKIVPKILERGHIRNDEEYHLLKEPTVDMGSAFTPEERKRAEKLLFEYEQRVGRSSA